MSIDVVKNILDIDLLHKLHDYVSVQSSEYAWRPNTVNWNNELTFGSSPIMTMDLSMFREELYSSIACRFPEIKEKELTLPYPMFFSMPPLSQIGWHEDYTPFNVSIYLNEFWDKQWGGMFIYENQENGFSGIVPEFNKAVVAYPETPHHVSMINPLCPTNRFSIQLFFVEPE
jgi:hypothetical protein